VIPFYGFPEDVRRIIYTTDVFDKPLAVSVLFSSCADDLVAKSGV
jgi:hypothetical protein